MGQIQAVVIFFLTLWLYRICYVFVYKAEIAISLAGRYSVISLSQSVQSKHEHFKMWAPLFFFFPF